MADSEKNQSPIGHEVEIDLLQRRLHNKTQRITRAIQFNVVALSLVVGLVQIGETGPIEMTLPVLTGGLFLLLSTGFALAGISLNGVPLPLSMNEKPTKAGKLIDEYRSRNRTLWWFTNLALGLGSVGAGLLLVATFRVVDPIKPTFPIGVIAVFVFLVLAGSFVFGYFRSSSELSDEDRDLL
jgi:hypothetical protein